MAVNRSKKIIVIGAGIAGLSTGIYAQLNGYQSKILEQHTLPGGLMTAWKRKGYTIDGCIHWLSGSRAGAQLYPMWQDIGLIQNREIFDPEIFVRIEGKNGEVLNLYTDIDRLEKHLLEISPQDKSTIREICSVMRKFSRYNPLTGDDLMTRLRNLWAMIPIMPLFMKWGRTTMKELGAKFKHPFLKRYFSDLWFPEMSAAGLLVTMGWLSAQMAGYPRGGSLLMAQAVEQHYLDLGGKIQYGARVVKILVEDQKAVGVLLEDGSEERGDIIISAADGHATLFDMLEGKFLPEEFQNLYQSAPIFQPIVLVGLGVNRKFDELPALTGGLILELSHPIQIAGVERDRLELMVYNFDAALAPEGKTAVTLMIESNYAYWKNLAEERERYEAEKEEIALSVIKALDERFPGFSGQVEMADVATPLTFEHYTGNWQGSFEGWLPTPQAMMKPIPKVLSGLCNFYMVGQWVQPGGGLPSGVMTAQEVLKLICKKEGVKFKTSVS
jgi:phytoene dehydrogenase-like protein